jgi:hypothetical protein
LFFCNLFLGSFLTSQSNAFANLCSHFLLIAYLSQGDLAQACAYGELAVEQAPTPADQAWAGSALAWAWCRTGEAQRGVEKLAQIATTLQGGWLCVG